MSEDRSKKTKPQGKINLHTVLKGILSGEKHYKIAEQAGSIAKTKTAKSHAIKQVLQSKTYREMSKSFIDKLDDEVNRLIEHISGSQLSKVEYDKAVSSLEKLEKMQARLKGGVTERVELDIKDVKSFLEKS